MSLFNENYNLFVGPFILWYINNPHDVEKDLNQGTKSEYDHVNNVINELYINSNFNLFSLENLKYNDEVRNENDEEIEYATNKKSKYDILDTVIPDYFKKIKQFISIFNDKLAPKLCDNYIKNGINYNFTTFITNTVRSNDKQLSIFNLINNYMEKKGLSDMKYIRIINSFIPFITSPTIKNEYLLYSYYTITKYDIKNLLNNSLNYLNSVNINKDYKTIKTSNKINVVFRSFQYNTVGNQVCLRCAYNYFIKHFINDRNIYDFVIVNEQLKSDIRQNKLCNNLIYIDNDLCKNVVDIENQLNEEHILPAYVLSKPYYFGYLQTKDIFREMNPILTDLHNLFLTEKNINTARTNWRYAEIEKKDVTNLLRYTNDKNEIKMITEEMKQKIDVKNYTKIEQRPRKYIDHIFVGYLTDAENKNDKPYIIKKDKNTPPSVHIKLYQKEQPYKLIDKVFKYNLINTLGIYTGEQVDWNVPPGIMISDKDMIERIELMGDEKLKKYNKISNTYGNFEKGEVNSLWTKTFCLNKFSGACGLFEPRDADKGKVARAMLYMLLVYGAQYINRFEYIRFMMFYTRNSINMYVKWAKKYLPDEAEKEKNKNVFKFQGNFNPFIQIKVKNDWKDFNTDLYDNIFLISKTDDNHIHLPVTEWIVNESITTKSPSSKQNEENSEIECLKHLK